MAQIIDGPVEEGVKIAVSIDAIGCNIYYLPSNYIFPDEMFMPGGVDLIDAVERHIEAKYDLKIGRLFANIVLKKIGSAPPLNPEQTTSVDSVQLSSAEIRDALASYVGLIAKNIADAVPSIAKKHGVTDEELSQITIILRGEFSYLKGLHHLLQEMTGLRVIVE